MGRPRAQLGTKTRVLALVGHTGAGKTQLAEAMLHAGGALRRQGRVDDGTALLDLDPEERARHGTAFPGVAWLPWGDATVHLVDTPGHDAAAYVTTLARAGTDADLLVVGAPDGVEGLAEAALRRARHVDRPLIVALSKVDRASDLPGLLARMGQLARRPVVGLQLPVHEDGRLVGVVDLVGDRLLRFDPEGSGAFSPEPVPAPRRAEVAAAREALLEAVAMTDEALLEDYLEHLELAEDVVWAGLAAAVQRGQVVPVLLTSALLQVGVAPLLDALVALTPDPEDWVLPAGAPPGVEVVAQWFGTFLDEDGAQVALLRVWHGQLQDQARVRVDGQDPVRLSKLYQVRGPRRARAHDRGPGALVATWDQLPGRPGSVLTVGPAVPLDPPPARPCMAWVDLRPRGPVRDGELAEGLAWLARLDPSLHGQTVPDGDGVRLSGSTQRQLQLAVERLRTRRGLHVDVLPPRVAYRERLRRPARGVGIHRGVCDGEDTLLGEVWLDVAPSEAGWTFEARVDSDVLPERFLPPAADGARSAIARGPRGGFPVDGLVVRCTGGEYDALESTEDHFRLAAHDALLSALQDAGTDLLEPWSHVVLTAPREEVGAVLAELAAHRARVHDVQVRDEEAEVEVHCPDEAFASLGTRLEACTRGRAWFVARPAFYERVDEARVPEVLARVRSREVDDGGEGASVGRGRRARADGAPRSARRAVPT